MKRKSLIGGIAAAGGALVAVGLVRWTLRRLDPQSRADSMIARARTKVDELESSLAALERSFRAGSGRGVSPSP